MFYKIIVHVYTVREFFYDSPVDGIKYLTVLCTSPLGHAINNCVHPVLQKGAITILYRQWPFFL